MLHVGSVERSIAFYRLLGFELVDVEGPQGCLGWARMRTDDGSAIMFLLAEEGVRVEPEKQGILLALYTPGLPALRAQLVAAGVRAPEIEHPPWMPSGHLFLRDPDGYGVGINHWSDAEHDAWLKLLDQKRAAGRIP
ncbi:MAG TPA: VOC family protein [Terriglobales bacterium]|nr:VOC family protein [Terriglobales bacterium]